MRTLPMSAPSWPSPTRLQLAAPAERKHAVMIQPQSRIHAAVTRARIERVIARLPEFAEEHLDAIEATLFEIGDLRAACDRCGQLYRPYSRALPRLPAGVVCPAGLCSLDILISTYLRVISFALFAASVERA